MKSLKSKLYSMMVLVFVTIMVTSGDLLAQCAMCRASVETNVNEDGIGFAAKLNAGILYLFIMPYLLAIVIGYMWYKKSKEHRRKLMETEYRKRRFANL